MIKREALIGALRWLLLPPLVMLLMVATDPWNANLHPYSIPSAIAVSVLVGLLFYLRRRK